MASGERKPRSHTEANKELFEKLERYSAELESTERKLKRGQKTLDSFFSQFDSPKSHDIKVSVYDPDLEAPRDHDINIKPYDPDNPDPEPESPIKKPEIPREPSHDIDVKLYDPGNHDLEPETTETAEKVPTYEKLSKQEIKDVFNQAEFKSLEAMDFISEYAPPKYKVNSIGGAEIYLSEVIPENKRPHVVAYVKAEGKDTIVPNPFYRSSSSMLWRLLPQLRSNGGYGKSNYEENAINAPFELQSTIEEIFADEQNDSNSSNRHNVEFASNLCDKIDRYLTPDERGEGNLTGIIEERFVDNKESLTPGYYASGSAGEFGLGFDSTYMVVLADPEECTVPSHLSPDFDHPVRTWKASGNTYGDVTARCFKSKDGTLEYLVFQDQEGDSWIGGIECTDAKTSSVGLKEQFVSPGSLATPLYEYHVPHIIYQDGRKGGGFWGDPKKRRHHYHKMNQYTSRIPMLREFNRQYSID